jgi:hypothetical protein
VRVIHPAQPAAHRGFGHVELGWHAAVADRRVALERADDLQVELTK